MPHFTRQRANQLLSQGIDPYALEQNEINNIPIFPEPLVPNSVVDNTNHSMSVNIPIQSRSNLSEFSEFDPIEQSLNVSQPNHSSISNPPTCEAFSPRSNTVSNFNNTFRNPPTNNNTPLNTNQETPLNNVSFPAVPSFSNTLSQNDVVPANTTVSNTPSQYIWTFNPSNPSTHAINISSNDNSTLERREHLSSTTLEAIRLLSIMQNRSLRDSYESINLSNLQNLASQENQISTISELNNQTNAISNGYPTSTTTTTYSYTSPVMTSFTPNNLHNRENINLFSNLENNIAMLNTLLQDLPSLLQNQNRQGHNYVNREVQTSTQNDVAIQPTHSQLRSSHNYVNREVQTSLQNDIAIQSTHSQLRSSNQRPNDRQQRYSQVGTDHPPSLPTNQLLASRSTPTQLSTPTPEYILVNNRLYSLVDSNRTNNPQENISTIHQVSQYQNNAQQSPGSHNLYNNVQPPVTIAHNQTSQNDGQNNMTRNQPQDQYQQEINLLESYSNRSNNQSNIVYEPRNSTPAIAGDNSFHYNSSRPNPMNNKVPSPPLTENNNFQYSNNYTLSNNNVPSLGNNAHLQFTQPPPHANNNIPLQFTQLPLFNSPPMDIEKFEGNYAQYKEFKIKVMSILASCSYSPEMKVIYLKKHLSGEPLDSVAGVLPDDPGAYNRIWSILDEDYGSAQLGLDHHLASLIDISNWPEAKSIEDLNKLYRHVSLHYQAIKHYGPEACQQAEAMKISILSTLTGYAAKRITQLRERNTNYNLEGILKELKTIIGHNKFIQGTKNFKNPPKVRKSLNVGTSDDNDSDDSVDKDLKAEISCYQAKSALKKEEEERGRKKKLLFENTKSNEQTNDNNVKKSQERFIYTSPSRSPSPVQFNCPFCQTNDHNVSECKRYDNRNAYWKHIFSNRWCSNCLRPGHKQEQCFRPSYCTTGCNRTDKHVTVLCDKYFNKS